MTNADTIDALLFSIVISYPPCIKHGFLFSYDNYKLKGVYGQSEIFCILLRYEHFTLKYAKKILIKLKILLQTCSSCTTVFSWRNALQLFKNDAEIVSVLIAHLLAYVAYVRVGVKKQRFCLRDTSFCNIFKGTH